MKKSLLLAGANFRKAKGSSVTVCVLMLIAALMLNLWLMLSLDYKENFKRYHDKLNAEHVMLVIDDAAAETREFLTDTLQSDERTAEVRLDDAMSMVGSIDYNGGEMNSEFVFLDKQTAVSRSIGKIEIVQDSSYTSGIYMPILYKSDKVAIGKTVDITVGSNKISFTVCGFFNSVMAGSHNCVMCALVLTADKYAELQQSNYAPAATLCSVRLKDKGQSADFEASFKTKISARYPSARAVSNSYAIVSQSRYISQMICSGIMSAMAFFVLLITLIVISSNIGNYIRQNMKNLGALKAVGYTGRQLIFCQLLQFLSLTLAAAVVGAALSYALFLPINAMMISQTGIPYALHFLPLPMIITLLMLGGAVAAVVWLSARSINRIEPIVALRSGVETHNFKHNRVPLDRTKAPLNLALAMKTAFTGVKHNLSVCVTMLVLSLIVVFSGLMTQNVINDITPFLNLIVGETADSCLNVQSEYEDEFLREMNADSCVEKIYLYNSVNVVHVGGMELLATVCDDFSKTNNQDMVFEGRFPKYGNEIALAAKYAKEKSLKIGEEMEIAANGKTERYLITGFTQVTNNLGKDCLLTRSGYERLGLFPNVSYYINLSDTVSVEDFNAAAKEKFNDNLNMAINIQTTVSSAASVYVTLMTMIVVAILIISAIIIAFVLYLLVRTMLNNKKRDYGILKALGFTTRQLIFQTAMSFMPAVILSTVVGIVVSCFVINPLVALFLSGIGIVKCTFSVPIDFVALAGAGLVLFAFGFACLLSLKIKKITPKTLLAGE